MPSSQRTPDQEAIEDDDLQFEYAAVKKKETQDRYPNRPINHGKTLPFHELFISLFNPLNENNKKPGNAATKRKRGPNQPSHTEMRDSIIERFMSRWRNDVGNDFYPAMRLIIPQQDRDRPMYGLKEKAIGKLLVKLLKLNPKSEDGFNLLNFKLPGQTADRNAGDFAGRCYEVLKNRSMRTSVGNMRIAQVNADLDRLAAASKEEDQLPIFENFYEQMDPHELMWLIRIILRQNKIGATEKTFLNHWHKDGEALFNVSSSLRRVCWELVDPSIRLEGDDTSITLMSCFQPQLAQFKMKSFQEMVKKITADAIVDKKDPEYPDEDFWIEEKLDGERMQMHMAEDENSPRGFKFSFWSRKAKDYTHLYGKSFEDETSALTQHIKDAFDPNLRNIILDGEMITWDPETDMMVPFGTLKTAALGQQRNPFGTGIRPLFRVFDCLYFNDMDITQYKLRDRRNALERCVKNVHRRLEILSYEAATSADAIEPKLRQVVAESSEGLVLKNPRSRYSLNDRNDNWIKVKPEYMNEFGESLDCLIIGGYYGSGHKGGRLSSFLCGLRVDQNKVKSQGGSPMKFYSFFKVGGGFRAEDYANIMHHTEDKWVEWDRKHPPKYIELGGPDGQTERPDVWIKPSDSLVLEVKAASVAATDSFRTKYTLRFPRFKRLRMDKDWQTTLSLDEFVLLKQMAEEESKEKKMTVDSRGHKISKRLKKELIVAGNDSKIKTPYAGPKMGIFEGTTFCVLSDMVYPTKKTKGEIEHVIKSNGGTIVQSPTAQEKVTCLGDKNVVKVASLVKRGITNVIRPAWVFDALKQAEIDGPGKSKFLIPVEPKHGFHIIPDWQETIAGNVDAYGDSYTRDISVDELRKLFDDMIHPKNSTFSSTSFLTELEERGKGLGEMRGSIFRGCVAWFASFDDEENPEQEIAKTRLQFAGGAIADGEDDENITHVVVTDENPAHVKSLKRMIAGRTKHPRLVKWAWVLESWKEGTRLDEERYDPIT